MKMEYKLKYVGMGSTHTPGTLRSIPSGFLNRLCKTHLSQKPSFHSERVDKIFPENTKALHKSAVLAPPTFPTLG